MPLWFQTALLPQGWADSVRVSIADRRIVRIDTGVDPVSIDEQHAVGLPGLCNVHSHGFQRGMAGLAEVRGPENDNFWTWREVMYRFLDRLDPEQIEAITAMAYVEMLEGGFTRVGEFHYLHHDPSGQPYASLGETAERIAAAAARTGIGLTLLPVFYAHSNFGDVPPSRGQRRFINTVDRFGALMEASRKSVVELPDANVGVAPHSLRAVMPGELQAVIPLARGGPVHIHAAEQTKEVEECVAWSGQRPVEWLLAHENVGERWCLVHATHLTLSETRTLANSGAVAGLCAVTEANLGDGIFPTPDYLGQDGRIGLGTDSNVQIGVAAELCALEYAQRLATRSRNVLAGQDASTGRTLFDRALCGGAQALDQNAWGICEDGPADLLSLDTSDPVFFGRRGDAILDSWIFASGKVDSVWRGGRKVVERGQHAAREAVAAGYRRALQSVLE